MRYIKTIHVTAQDIALGQRRRACRDAVALAMQRALGTTVSVGMTNIVIHGGPIIPTPEPIRAFITLFDQGMKVQPTEFRLTWDYED